MDAARVRYLNFVQHIVASILRMQRELHIPACETFPQSYDSVMRLHDDLACYKKSTYALRQWTETRYLHGAAPPPYTTP